MDEKLKTVAIRHRRYTRSNASIVSLVVHFLATVVVSSRPSSSPHHVYASLLDRVSAKNRRAIAHNFQLSIFLSRILYGILKLTTFFCQASSTGNSLLPSWVAAQLGAHSEASMAISEETGIGEVEVVEVEEVDSNQIEVVQVQKQMARRMLLF
jgi:hypothetical protein